MESNEKMTKCPVCKNQMTENVNKANGRYYSCNTCLGTSSVDKYSQQYAVMEEY